MSLDDQLFKQDGTLITWIDVLLLRIARFVTHFFVREDEETFLPATRRMYKASKIFFIVCISLQLVNTEIFGALASLYFCNEARTKKCENAPLHGRGTNIPHSSKRLILLLTMVLPSAILIFSAISDYPRKMLIPVAITGAVMSTSLLFFLFLEGYVERLGDVPPKKKKVKAPRLAFSPQ